MIAATVVSLLGASPAFAEGTKITAKAECISLFEVPLRCEAAPEIGCGSRSKPILLGLEREPTITEAWLNRTGTVLAVVGAEGSSRESRTKVVQSVLEKNGAAARELDDEARETELKSFVSANGWYRGAEVDNLSKQEARTIAARLVRRVEAKTALPEEQAKALETGLVGIFQRRFIGNSDNSDPTCKRQQLVDELSKLAHENLDEKGIASFREAIAKGIRPLAEDREETKTETTAPDCCSKRAPGQS